MISLVTAALGRLTSSRGRVTEEKSGALIAIEGLGRPHWMARDYAAFAREGVMQNPIVYRSVRMIAEASASVPLLVYEGDVEQEQHPLAELVSRPGPAMTRQDLMETWIGHLMVDGNGYLEAVAVGDDIRELVTLRPDRVRVVCDEAGWADGYEYRTPDGVVRIAGEAVPGVRRVLHLRLFHPLSDHAGLSPIEAAAVAIDIHNAASRWNKALLDNAARPSGALVYAGGQSLTRDQFDRLKAELAESFQGARNAGRPLLLEGGLDWKAMSLSPRDMDFMEAKHSAARDIALALGVPPMLLGIPGDNTYSNYQEASRAFWRQTVIPLVHRSTAALSAWLAPAWGGTVRLVPDLDGVDALLPEREALWARLERASFLARDEKRVAAGYPPDGGEGEAGGADKFNPYHDALGRFTTADGAGGGDRLAQAGPRGGSGSFRPAARFPAATPAQLARLEVASNAQRELVRRARELDPNWRPTPSLSNPQSAEGEIARLEAEGREAAARVAELLPRGFGSYESYAEFGRSIRQGFAAAGYTDVTPMLRGSAVTGSKFRTGRPFDEKSDYDLAIVSPSMMQRAQELGIGLRTGGTRTEPLNPEHVDALGLRGWAEAARIAAGRKVSLMIYESRAAVAIRGESRSVPER